MKSIVLLLLLLVVSTSGNKMYSWQNLTGVHQDEGIWDSLAQVNYIFPITIQPQKTCGGKAGACTGNVNGMKYSKCVTYDRCKRLMMG
ncbi:unnamed protein product [Eruca vesicaria subsp. sativa]|uniref:Uncharacterized protein n=1 Tax=Eruca vesicaria subsp. sativa TaxID=29727 RepID=A0ABC8JVE1_ERUVS|nr:unnamed protein product [Eruca vesicaria subsp. sativa]